MRTVRHIVSLLFLLLALTAGLQGALTFSSFVPALDPLDETFPEWERLFGPPGGYIERIGQCAAAQDVFYAAGGGEGLYKTTAGGLTWLLLPSGDRGHGAILLVDPVDPDGLYLAAQNEGMFVSLDGGASWHPWNRGLDGKVPATDGNNVTRVLALSGDHRYLYFGAAGAGVYRREIHPPGP